MSLILGIETSSSQYGIVLGSSKAVLFDTSRNAWDRSSSDLGSLVSEGLKEIGYRSRDLKLIIVNIGPGGLGSVRSGVAFANALAFSLQISVCPVTYFEIVGAQLGKATSLPILSVLPAAGGAAYGGLYKDDTVTRMRVGPLRQVVDELCEGVSEIVVAGRLRGRVADLLPGTRVIDSGIERPLPSSLLEVGSLEGCEQDLRVAPRVTPLNEQSRIFHET